jgi:HPt (histidine-containing phosphotransfer) domain-containing protein
MDDLPVLDNRIIAELQDLGPDFLAQLVPIFALAVPDRIAAIQAAIQDRDAEELSSAAHALRGSAANLAGVRVAEVCGRLEESARADRLDDTAVDVIALETELVRMLAALTSLLQVPV